MPLVKYVAEILGYLMNGIYLLLDKAGIPNVALAIILFTIVMYLLMTPLQISQQRFSKLNAVMSPEIQKVQAKYKGKRDQVSQQKMLDETNAIYAKYGVNQAGSCIQLLIQMRSAASFVSLLRMRLSYRSLRNLSKNFPTTHSLRPHSEPAAS